MSDNSTESAPDRPILGAAFNCLGLGVISLQDIIVKLLSDRYSVWQFSAARSLVGFVIIALVLLVMGKTEQFSMHSPKVILLRGVFSFGAYVCYFLSIASLPLAYAVAVFFVSPLLVTALSVPILRERVGVHRWLAVSVGFIGLLVIVRPGFDSITPAILLALSGAFFYALRLLSVRVIGPADSAATISMYSFAMFGVLSGVGALLFSTMDWVPNQDASLAFLARDWSMPSATHLMLMAATGLISTVAHVLSIKSYQLAPASLVSAFEYSYFIWAVLFGYIFWREVPDRYTLIGVGLLVGAGLYVIWRERLAASKV